MLQALGRLKKLRVQIKFMLVHSLDMMAKSTLGYSIKVANFQCAKCA